MSDAFYLSTDEPDRFLATPCTEGPWGNGAQHAGPPSALVGRAVERLPTTFAGPAQVARVTVEVLGPVPVGEMRVHAEVTRPGRTVELVEAELSGDGRTSLRARVWRIRGADLDLPPAATAAHPPAPPRPAKEAVFLTPFGQTGYIRATEWRFVEGHFEAPGPATVWARQRVPLVAGEEPSGLQRLLVLADSGNGLSGVLDAADWWFINTELTVHLHRVPAGEWMCLRAATTLDASGVGLAETELYDATGRVGRAAQALFLGPRPTGSGPGGRRA